ncbi:hypothetical protein PENSPDRAFT_671199 [Peniophora sp. CONT]|nr:hypothetical protein PENSPDRAFT_671199 [Peniophora sp. CONT]
MHRQKPLTYGEIADTVLPAVVFTVDTLNILSQSVDTYVQLAPRDRRLFLQEQMEKIWPEPIDWTALQRYYQEHGRIRGPPAIPEGTTSRKWTGLRVCGIVYRDSIDEMVFLGTGMRPGDPRGYIGHRMKCRTVYFWKLSPSERKLLREMAEDWQRGGPPTEQKMEAYYRRFQTFIHGVHMTALREFGQHMVTMVVPEPGLTNPPRLYEFMYELKILDRPLVKTVPVGDTLSDIFLEVNHAAGRIEGAALPAVLNKKSRLKRKTTWSLDEKSFIGHDEIVLREDEFDEELFFKEAISMVYLIVRMAHSNISRYRDLDPPWSSFHDLVDEQYLLPDVPMSIPTTLRQPNCFLYLKHWFTVTKGLKFNMWQRKNSVPTAPVPLDERWWAASLSDYVQPEDAVPPTALAAIQFIPERVPEANPPALHGPLSPFGSAGGHLVHDEDVREQEALDMLDIPAVPDPDDVEPSCDEVVDRESLSGALIPPCLVPANGEARAQWCMIQLQSCGLPLRATRLLKSSIQLVAELPMIPNASYPLTSAGKRTGLPQSLRWTMSTATLALIAEEMTSLLTFLQSEPWTLQQAGQRIFAGTELVWTYVLGWTLYLKGYAAGGGSCTGNAGAGIFSIGYSAFTRIFATFREAMLDYAEPYEYPGWPPSSKYALVSSRSQYLAYLMDGPLQLPFAVIPHSVAHGAPSWILEPFGVPSWQWQRCGLPPAAHRHPDLADEILSWLRIPDLLITKEGTPRTRETALAVLLKVALIFSDLENIDDEKWTLGAAALLEQSTLRPHTRQLKLAIADWANEQTISLERLLLSQDLLDLHDDTSGEAGFSVPAIDLQCELPGRPAKRKAASDEMPPGLDDLFHAVDFAAMNPTHSVAEYQADIAEQPRTAVQELGRKGLQGLASLEERKKVNRAIRQAMPRATNATPAPAPLQMTGGWQPMPPGQAVGSIWEQEQPPRKKQKKRVVKRPRQHQLPTHNTTRPKAHTKPVRRRRKTPVQTDDTPERSDSESIMSFGSTPVGVYAPEDQDEEMPSRISSPAGTRFASLVVPVGFDAMHDCTGSLETRGLQTTQGLDDVLQFISECDNVGVLVINDLSYKLLTSLLDDPGGQVEGGSSNAIFSLTYSDLIDFNTYSLRVHGLKWVVISAIRRFIDSHKGSNEYSAISALQHKMVGRTRVRAWEYSRNSHPNAIDHAVLAESLKWETALQASISGALALQNVTPVYPPGESWDGMIAVTTRTQGFAYNTSDGLYDFLENYHRRPSKDDTWRDFTPEDHEHVPVLEDFVKVAGIDPAALCLWWNFDHPAAPQDDIGEAGLAAHIYLTTTNQRMDLQDLVKSTEETLMGTYEQLYADAPDADGLLARRYFTRDVIMTHERVEPASDAGSWEFVEKTPQSCLLTAVIAMSAALVPYRELSPLQEMEDQEGDLYLARHNSVIDFLGSDVDRTLDDAEFDLPQLVKGLAFEALIVYQSFCHVVSGNFAIRGIRPHIPQWQETIQYHAGVASRTFLAGSQGVDVQLTDGNFRLESRRWMLQSGEGRRTAAEWWKPGNNTSVLDGAVAEAGQAAEIYLHLERYKDAKRRDRLAQSTGEIEQLRQLLGLTSSVRQMMENMRDRLHGQIEQHEEYLAALYHSRYPDVAQNGTMASEGPGIRTRTMEDVYRRKKPFALYLGLLPSPVFAPQRLRDIAVPVLVFDQKYRGGSLHQYHGKSTDVHRRLLASTKFSTEVQ